jgi:hypothetical protein
MLHTSRPENRCRSGSEPSPAWHALRSEAFAEDLAEPAGANPVAPRNGTMPAPWWWKVLDAQWFKTRDVAGLPAGAGLGGRPA